MKMMEPIMKTTPTTIRMIRTVELPLSSCGASDIDNSIQNWDLVGESFLSRTATLSTNGAKALPLFSNCFVVAWGCARVRGLKPALWPLNQLLTEGASSDGSTLGCSRSAPDEAAVLCI